MGPPVWRGAEGSLHLLALGRHHPLGQLEDADLGGAKAMSTLALTVEVR